MATLTKQSDVTIGRRGQLAALVAMLAAMFVSAPTAAREYTVDKFDKRLSREGSVAKRFARSPVAGGEEERAFRAYIEGYFFPAMTRAAPEGLEDLGDAQTALFKGMLWATNRANQKYLTDQALAFATRVLGGKGYHPAVRYNALLILGRLDDQYAGPDNADPTPHARANELLCKLAERARVQAARPRYELVGSLIGLRRHARHASNLPEKNQNLMMKTLFTLLARDELEGDYGPEVRDWIYLTAAEAVGGLGTSGPKGAFYKALAARAADDSLRLETRAAIAAQLNRLDGKPGAFDASSTVQAIQELAAEVTSTEAKLARKLEKATLRRGGTQIVANERDKTYRRLEQEGRTWVLVRDGLLDELLDLRRAVRGAAKVAEGDDAATLATIETSLTETINLIGDEETIQLNVTKSIKDLASDVEAVAPVGDVEDEEPEVGPASNAD